MRILILLAIGLLLYIVISNILRKNKIAANNKQSTISEKMVRCNYCGLHILEQEAMKAGKHFYCSQSHLEADSHTR